MRKILLSLAALAAFGIAVPTMTSAPASAETVIIKKHDRYHRYHRYDRHYGWWHRHHHHDRDAAVVIRHRS